MTVPSIDGLDVYGEFSILAKLPFRRWNKVARQHIGGASHRPKLT